MLLVGRGFKLLLLLKDLHTKSDLPYLSYFFPDATVAGDLTNIILDPIFIFVLRLGVSGAAIAHVLSQ